jgi:copper resistance protein B
MSASRISSLTAALIAFATCAAAQIPAATDQPVIGMEPGGAVQPVMDRPILAHAILNENEGRWNGTNTQYRWDGEGWVGTDYDKLWINRKARCRATVRLRTVSSSSFTVAP